MKNLTQINIFGLPSNAISKIFTLLEDKDILRLREICHSTKDKVDASILNKDEDDVLIDFYTYFNVLRNRSYAFLRIALFKIRAELPILTIKPHEDRNEGVHFTLKMENFRTFLDLLRPRIAGVEWRRLCLYEAAPDIIRILAIFFKGKHINGIHVFPMIVENFDYSHWLALIRNVSAAEFSCCYRSVAKDDCKFFLELSEIVYSSRISFGETQINLVSIAKAMLIRKCVHLDFSFNLFTHSELESLIAFFHHSEKKISFRAHTQVAPLYVHIGAYYVKVYDWQPPQEGERIVIIAPLEYRE